MAKLSKLKVGQTLWTVRRGRMGNTTVKTVNVHTARVLELREDAALVSWNGNTPEWLSEYRLSGYKTSEPCTVSTWRGCGARMATREERKSILAERKAKAASK